MAGTRAFPQPESGPASWWLGAAGIGASLLALWAGTAREAVCSTRLVVMLASIVIYFFGFALRVAAVPLMLLAFSIPIPQIIFNRVAFPLQLFASRCAVAAMSFFSIPVLRQGNVIELMPLGATEPKKLAVVEACSGIRSLMTLVTLAMIYAYFTGPKSGRKTYGVLRFVILVLAAVPIAILTNALRVSGTGVLAHYYGTGIADGFFHSFSGWVIYIVAAALLLTTGWLMARVARLWNKHDSQPPSQSANLPLNEAKLYMKRSSNLSFELLLIVLLLKGRSSMPGRTPALQRSRKALKEFPAQIGSWQQQGEDVRFDDETEKVCALTIMSRNFQSNGRVASLYVGYYATQRNGATYHSPLNCLPGSGWVMSDGGKMTITPAGAPFEANRYVIQNGNQRALMIYWYQGVVTPWPASIGKIYTALDSVRRRRSDGAGSSNDSA
jgi:exosortase D (VPLPA-CTERM-specific)